MQSNRNPYLYRTLLFLGLCVLALVALRPAIAQAFGPMMPPPPPPPPPPPTVTPVAPAPSQLTGGFIELRVQFPANWPWRQAPWQTLYTQVQWQDKQGAWHDVEGWRGELDKLVEHQGHKTWWLEQALFNKGPFRWIVYNETRDSTLATSEPFTLPSQTAERTVVEVTLQ